jgi:stage III sporulation protein AC
MDVNLILKVCGISMIITVVCHIMSKAGKDDQSAMVSLLGVVLILIILAEKIGVLVNTLKEVFGI